MRRDFLRRRRARTVIRLSLLLFTLTGCAPAVSTLTWTVPSCPSALTSRSEVRWFASTSPRELERSRYWCERVGPVAFGGSAPVRADARAGALLIVNWNVGSGRGKVQPLLRRLADEERRAGRPQPDFILLLQETVRFRPVVRPSDAPGAHDPSRPALDGQEGDVVTLAAQLAMNFVYIPSMRRGAAIPGESGEDLGNAILSTLPLRDLTAIELPFVRQRRVAVAASVDTGGGSLTVVSVHLATRPPLLGGSIFWGPIARSRQAAALVDAVAPMPVQGAIVIGGDFNTFAGNREPAVRIMERRFARMSCGSTITQQWGLPLDYFFASDAAVFQDCRRLSERFGSDHHPLVARAIRPHRLASDLLFLRGMKNIHRKPADDPNTRGAQKDPDDWKTGDEPMTPAQRSYLETLAQDTGEAVSDDLSKAEASKLIDQLRNRSPRVQGE